MAAVARGAVALVLLVDHLDARVVFGVAAHGSQRIVGAAVVEQDNLQVLVRLPHNAVKALLQVRTGVVNRYNYRDKRFAHVLPLNNRCVRDTSVRNSFQIHASYLNIN